MTVGVEGGPQARASVHVRLGRRGEPPAIAFSGLCTHLGCPVRFVEASQKFICPCHGGVFGADGVVEGGPPKRPLKRWKAAVHDSAVYLAPTSLD